MFLQFIAQHLSHHLNCLMEADIDLRNQLDVACKPAAPKGQITFSNVPSASTTVPDIETGVEDVTIVEVEEVAVEVVEEVAVEVVEEVRVVEVAEVEEVEELDTQAESSSSFQVRPTCAAKGMPEAIVDLALLHTLPPCALRHQEDANEETDHGEEGRCEK